MPQVQPGGVAFTGGWKEVWRANLELRGATRILARIGGFPAVHLAQLDKRATKFPFTDTFRAGTPVKVDVTSRKSKIYHAGAAAERITRALEGQGIPVSAEADLRLMVRIESNFVTFSVDTSGASLHKRGHKEAVGKAPMRETLAALFLRAAGFDGTGPVLDPMCGSGTFALEAAEIALGRQPGRARAFAFEALASADPDAIAALRQPATDAVGPPRFFGSDRDQGAVGMATKNATSAGLSDITRFETRPASEIFPPVGPPGLVVVNPPYGARVGNKKLLFALHGALGETLKSRFSGWRVALVTSEAPLAKATGLPFGPPGPYVPHGGLKIRLWTTGPLR